MFLTTWLTRQELMFVKLVAEVEQNVGEIIFLVRIKTNIIHS